MLTCALNLSEGRDEAVLEVLAMAAGGALLDLHADPWHHRCVLTIGGPTTEAAARRVAEVALERIDLRHHRGVHPRLGALDVVPFTPSPPYEAVIGGTGRSGPQGDLTAQRDDPTGPNEWRDAPLEEALRARDDFVSWASAELGLACFCYGPERSLPDVRRRAFTTLAPDAGPSEPDPGRGACCVGARGALVAYNVVLEEAPLATARRIAAELRSPLLRTLGLASGEDTQVSCNLVAPLAIGPAEAADLVAARATVARCELVGLLPRAVLDRVPPERWRELDLGTEQTLERRLTDAGLAPPSSATGQAPPRRPRRGDPAPGRA